jgi:hypothetical protein
MPAVYSYAYSSEGDGTGPWWGIQCPKHSYEEMIQQMQETRCFVYLTNLRGETLAIAVEGFHSADMDIIFAPDWVLARLGVSDGDNLTIDQIVEPLPKATLVRIQPITNATVEGPMFIEGLTEALNQLGIVQEGLLSAIVDPSMPDLHQFTVEGLNPAKVCLADGELEVDLVSAVDYIAPTVVPTAVPSPAASPEPQARPSTPIPNTDFSSLISAPTSIPMPKPTTGFVPFSGRGRRLDGKDSGV